MTQFLRNIALLAALLGLAAVARAQAATAEFRLAAADVHKLVLILTKPDRLVLEATYSKEKQAELIALTSGGSPKTVRITLADTPMGERSFKSPATGHSLKFDVRTIDDAVSHARALGWPVETGGDRPAAGVFGEAEVSLLNLAPADTDRLILFLFKPTRTYLDVYCGEEKRGELAFLRKHNPERPVLVNVGGQMVAMLPPGPTPNAGPLRLDMTSPDTALRSLRILAPHP